MFIGAFNYNESEYDGVPVHGHSFSSRPDSLTFWYKYVIMIFKSFGWFVIAVSKSANGDHYIWGFKGVLRPKNTRYSVGYVTIYNMLNLIRE